MIRVRCWLFGHESGMALAERSSASEAARARVLAGVALRWHAAQPWGVCWRCGREAKGGLALWPYLVAAVFLCWVFWSLYAPVG